ncbi:MAG: large conductance mechanosensitive channel protein MscL [Crocinitomicaceae bacterium]|nr:large conductance mechanosensitive channel protein MscL [Crocinitomicaceae bacterium]
MLKEFKPLFYVEMWLILAAAVIIGAAFGAIVSSMVTDVLTPLILNPVMEHLHVSKLEEVAWHGVLYGKFIATVINFVIVAFVIFLMVKGMNKAIKKKAAEPAAPKEPTNEKLLAEIRDLLKIKVMKLVVVIGLAMLWQLNGFAQVIRRLTLRVFKLIRLMDGRKVARGCCTEYLQVGLTNWAGGQSSIV